MLVTTTNSIEGFKIINYLSIVTVNIYREMRKGINIDLTMNELKNEAMRKYNADAVVGIKFFTYSEMMGCRREIAYGTAVKLERK